MAEAKKAETSTAQAKNAEAAKPAAKKPAAKKADTKKTLRVTQVKSSIGYKSDQGKTLKALGLGKIGRSVDQVDNPCVRGMIFKVKHLVKVEEL